MGTVEGVWGHNTLNEGRIVLVVFVVLISAVSDTGLGRVINVDGRGSVPT